MSERECEGEKDFYIFVFVCINGCTPGLGWGLVFHVKTFFRFTCIVNEHMCVCVCLCVCVCRYIEYLYIHVCISYMYIIT